MNKKPLNWDAFNKNVDDVLGEDFWNDIQEVLPRRGPTYDLFDLDEKVVLMIDLPGLTKKDRLELTQEGKCLLIEGELASRPADWQENIIHGERLYGDFRRSIQIPFTFGTEDIQANFHNGVLLVSIRKSPPTQQVHVSPSP